MTFTFTVSAADWGRIAPELVLVGMALLVMLADLLLPRAGVNMKDSEQGLPVPQTGFRKGPPRGRPQGSPPPNHTTPAPMDQPPLALHVRAGLAPALVLPLLSLLGIVGAFAATIVLFIAGDFQTAFNSMIGSDQGSLYAYIIVLSASALGVLLSPAYLKRINVQHQGEYYALMLLGTIGMLLMAAATSFLTIFLGLEMLSLALYILSGFVTRRKTSQEAGMKYFLLSSFASAFLLYGIALIYGATGYTTLSGIRAYLLSQARFPVGHPIPNPLSLNLHGSTLLLLGMGLLTVGFAFKVSAVPFHAWTPDVYEGAPTPITGFMSVATKAAALIAFVRVFDVALFPVRSDWRLVILAITILTIVGGNVLALVQSNVKRLLAYSSIAHAGYLLIGVVAGSEVVVVNGRLVVGGIFGISAILFYLLSYTFLNLGAFGVVSVLERVDSSGNDLADIRGLWYRRPLLAGTLAFFMLALAGFPPMAGFAAKYYLFYAALQSGHPELLIIGVLASVLGMYYYLRVIAVMFMEQESTGVDVTRPARVSAPAPALAAAGRRASTKLPEASVTPKDREVMAAVTQKRATVKPKPAVAVEQTSTKEPRADLTAASVGWTTWLALGLAAAGTLAMGTILPFWLVNLAQQAAQMMLK